MSPSFTGGALSFKGDKKKKTKNKKKSTDIKHSLKQRDDKKADNNAVIHVPGDDAAVAAAAPSVEETILATMTDAERKAYKRKKDRERMELEKVARKSHRERVDDFNEKLSQLTEHNDLPRVSAAGNG